MSQTKETEVEIIYEHIFIYNNIISAMHVWDMGGLHGIHLKALLNAQNSII